MSGDELFDVVDEFDRPVRRMPRRDVHAGRLRHRAIHVLIFDRQGQVFLQKRSAAKDMAPLTWDSSCSGHVDAGEEYDAACVRELQEELGVALERPPERWARIEAVPETGNEFVWVYRLNREGPFQLNPEEIDAGAWYTPAALTARIQSHPEQFSPAFRYIWSKVEATASSLPRE